MKKRIEFNETEAVQRNHHKLVMTDL
jgi:hypothetical protein